MRTLPCLLIVALFLGLCQSDLRADETAGRVVALRGQVMLLPEGGEPRRLARGDTVLPGDTIRTGGTGRVQLFFPDGSIVSLGPGSEMDLAAYEWSPAEQDGAMQTRVNTGIFRIMGGAIARENPAGFTTETPVATIGIRGSMYAGRITDGRLTVLFQGGRGIEVRTEGGAVTIETPGLGTEVSDPRQPPAPPAELSDEQMAGLTLEAPEQEEDLSDEEIPGEEGEPSQEPGEEPEEPGAEVPEEQEETVPDIPATDVAADVTEDVNDAVGDSSQYEQEQELPPVTEPTPPPVVAMTGAFLTVLSDSADSTFGETRPGVVNATSTDGEVTLTATADDGSDLSTAFSITAYDPEATYAIPDLPASFPRNLALPGLSATTTLEVLSDNRGEFFVYGVPGLDAGGTRIWHETGFAGIPAPTLPSDGISGYEGKLLITGLQGAETHVSAMPVILEINWLNGSYIGVTDLGPDPDPSSAGYSLTFFGRLDGGKFGATRIIGDRFDPDAMGITWADGNDATGAFFGAEHQGTGFTAAGELFDIQDQSSAVGSWTLLGHGFREIELAEDLTSPQGSVSWEGYVVGVAEDMAQPEINRRVFANTAPADFALDLDRDAGTVSGTLTADNPQSPGTALTGLQVGGAAGSAYVLDDSLACVVADPSGTAVSSNDATGPLKDRGNFLFTEDPERKFNEFLTWGWWEIAYADPDSGADYHLHRPGSLWIAGYRTPQSVVQNLVDTNVTATYSGGAEGARFGPASMMERLTGGSCELTIDFAPTAPTPVSGDITFDQVTLPVANGFVSSSDATIFAEITGDSDSRVDGAFFGPAAEALGGSFDATLGGTRYLGIFGAERQ